MDYSGAYSEKAEAFRREVVDFIEENVPEDMRFPVESEDLDAPTNAFAMELRKKLAARGWLYPAWPREYGGGGMSWEERFVIEEEFLRYGVPKPYDLGRLLGAALLARGSDSQKKKYLPLIARGEIIVWQCFTEPEAGSDLAALQLRAIQSGDEFILNGQKAFVGDGHHGDYLFTLAVTDPKAPRHKNMSAFMVKADSPGITLDPLDPIAGSRKNAMYFEDVHVPAENRIGELGQGWEVANASLLSERGGWGDWFRVGELFREFLAYCAETKRDGIALIDEDGVQDLLAELYLKVRVWELFEMRRKSSLIHGTPVTYEGSQQSLHIKTILPQFAAAVLEIAGLRSMVTDQRLAILNGRIENFQRGSLMTHGAGTPEILRLVIGRALGLPSGKRR